MLFIAGGSEPLIQNRVAAAPSGVWFVQNHVYRSEFARFLSAKRDAERKRKTRGERDGAFLSAYAIAADLARRSVSVLCTPSWAFCGCCLADFVWTECSAAVNQFRRLIFLVLRFCAFIVGMEWMCRRLPCFDSWRSACKNAIVRLENDRNVRLKLIASTITLHFPGVLILVESFLWQLRVYN